MGYPNFNCGRGCSEIVVAIDATDIFDGTYTLIENPRSGEGEITSPVYQRTSGSPAYYLQESTTYGWIFNGGTYGEPSVNVATMDKDASCPTGLTHAVHVCHSNPCSASGMSVTCAAPMPPAPPAPLLAAYHASRRERERPNGHASTTHHDGC